MSYCPVSTPIIKPVNGQCNLSCLYCYTSGLKERIKENCMSYDTLKSTIDFFCRDQKNIEFIWHGGEPLLAGLEFYHKVIEFQRAWERKGRNIVNSIQTNATLVTPEWTNFFVGVSLDGPQKFHDRVRKYHFTGSYDDVMRGINLLRQANVFNGVICCVSTINNKFPKEIFNFFIAQNIKKLKFARVKNIGHCNDVSVLAVSPRQFYNFLITVFDSWLELDDQEVEIRDVQSVVNLLLGGNRRECVYMGQCDQFVTIYHDGSIYGCDSFPKTKSSYFGNILDEPSKIRSSIQLNHFKEIAEKRKKHCQRCDWYYICKGGCASDCYASPNASEPLNDVCESLKWYFEHISNRIRSYGLIQ